MATNGAATDGTSNVSPDVTNVDFLVVGMGPAGAGLACFLAQNSELYDSTYARDSLLTEQQISKGS